MYQIMCDNKILYDLRADKRLVINPTLNLEVNKSGSLGFSIPYNNVIGFNKLKSEFKVYDNEKLIFKGRALNDEKDFYNSNKIEVLGVLDYFNDSIVKPFELHNTSVADFLKFLIDNHNMQSDDFKKFNLGTVDVVDFDGEETLYRKSETYVTTWQVIEDRLLNRLGGYLRVRYVGEDMFLDYTTKSGDKNSQAIRFRQNLLDLNQFTKAEEIKTCIIPLGAKLENDEYVTIRSVNDGSDYICDTNAINLYGHIWGTKQWENVTEPGNLLTKAKEYLRECVNLAYTIELRAIDLSLINSNIENFKLGDYVQIISEVHGLNKEMQITKLDLDLSNPSNSKITVGDSFKGLTDKNISSKKNLENINSKINKTESEIVTVDNKVKNVSSKIDTNSKELKKQKNFIIMGV